MGWVVTVTGHRGSFWTDGFIVTVAKLCQFILLTVNLSKVTTLYVYKGRILTAAMEMTPQ